MFLVTGMREACVHGKDAATAIVSGYNHAVRVVVRRDHHDFSVWRLHLR